MTAPNLTAWAHRYAAQSWPILPLHSVKDGQCSCGDPECTSNAGKHPRTASGLKDASADPKSVEAWWQRWPDANIGMVPGHAAFLVIDVDGAEGETAAERLGLLAEPTLSVLTGRGRHLYYRHPGGTIGNKVLAPKLDLRADAGYVLLPPSLHRSGTRYRWLGRVKDAKPLPAAVVAKLTEQPPVTTPAPLTWTEPPGDKLEKRIRGYVAQLPRNLRDGDGRNAACFQFAAWLTHDLALSDAAAARWLDHWNVMQRAPLTARELRQILRNARMHGRRAYGVALAEQLFANAATTGTSGLFQRAQLSTGAPFGGVDRG